MSSTQLKAERSDLIDTPEPSPKRVLFIQLNRLGDLIQTAILATELKLQRPDLRVDLVARSTFSKQLLELLNQKFDNVYQIGMDDFLKEKSNLNDSSTKLIETIADINSSQTSILINQSFSKSSAILSSLIHSQFRFGMNVNKFGEIIIPDKWSQYIYSTVMAGNFNDIHLNDIFRMMIGVARTDRVDINNNMDSDIIALNPFSSHEKKSWRIEKWTEIIYQILKKESKARIALIGTPGETEILKNVKNLPLLKTFKDRILIHSNQSISQTLSIIQNSRLYLGHDSLCSNLATIANTRAIIIPLGTVRHQETFPDSIGNYILAPKTNCYPCFPSDPCSNYKCHADINYNVVTEVVSQIYSTGDLNIPSLNKNLNEFQLSQSEIFVTCQLPSKLMALKSLTDHQISLPNFAKGLHRISALYLYEEISESFGSSFCNFPEQTALNSFQYSLGQLFDLCQHGTNFSRYILEEVAKNAPCIATIKDYGKKIDEIDQLIGKIATVSPLLKPLCQIVLLKKSQLDPGHLVHLTEQTFSIYNESVALCKIVFELTQSAIDKNQKTNQHSAKMADV
jgi:ADP-heptose:LPS heptosyltransferase